MTTQQPKGEKYRINTWVTVIATSPEAAEKKVFDLLYAQDWVQGARVDVEPPPRPVIKKLTPSTKSAEEE